MVGTLGGVLDPVRAVAVNSDGSEAGKWALTSTSQFTGTLSMSSTKMCTWQEVNMICIAPHYTVLTRSCTAKRCCTFFCSHWCLRFNIFSLHLSYRIPVSMPHCRAGYLQFLPQCEYLPMFWTEQELELLKGTTLEGCADDDRYAYTQMP